MQTLLARKAISMTELREPAKVFAQAGNEPIAILNRNQVVGYFVPVGALEEQTAGNTVNDNELIALLKKRRPHIATTLKYLEDK